MGLFCHCDCHVAALDRVLQTFSRGLILAAERRHFPRRKAKISKSQPVCSQGLPVASARLSLRRYPPWFCSTPWFCPRNKAWTRQAWGASFKPNTPAMGASAPASSAPAPSASGAPASRDEMSFMLTPGQGTGIELKMKQGETAFSRKRACAAAGRGNPCLRSGRDGIASFRATTTG